MPLAHFGWHQKNFKELSGITESWEPVWNNLAEVRFTPLELEEKLSYQIFRVDGDLMYFNLNWDVDKNEVVPLTTIIKWMNKPIQTQIQFHDVEEKVMYRVKFKNFMFTEILAPEYFDWNDHTLKELVVRFKCDSKEIEV